jgi:hypothetical protein
MKIAEARLSPTIPRDIVKTCGWASVSGLVRSGRIDRSFDEFALLEHGSGPNEGDQVRRADEAVAEWDGPAQRIWMAAAEPDWRVRLLERFGFHCGVSQLPELPVEIDARRSP